MDFSTLPASGLDFISWDWEQIKPYFDDLAARPFDVSSVDAWLADWNRLAELIDEAGARLFFASTRNTEDAEAEADFARFNEEIRPKAAEAEQVLKDRLLASKLDPEGFDVPLAKIKVQAAIYRSENLPLLSQDLQLAMDYFRVQGAETIEWEGRQIPLFKVLGLLEQPDRATREWVWRLRQIRWNQDRAAFDEIWLKMLKVRKQIAQNAGQPDYLTYRWKQLLRLDYTPDDALRFDEAVEEVVVPVSERLCERRRQRLGYDCLKPWDSHVDQFNKQQLKPFETVDELESKILKVFSHVDPELAAYFDIMRREKLLDIDSRPNKAPTGYALPLEAVHRAAIFLSTAGIPMDVDTMLHEGGHAFHVFESAHLPHVMLRGEAGTQMEFGEVASMAMEMLGLPYLGIEHGGFYSEQELARARHRHLEEVLLFWPYMSVIDCYQHWVYTHIDEAMDINACDRAWRDSWNRFMRGVDYSGGLEDSFISMRWRIQAHLFDAPLYYIEYGLAQLGAVQVWANALKDQAAAVAQYRAALRLGGSKHLPDLYKAAGATLAFDADTLSRAVELIEEEMEKTEASL